MYLFIKLFRRLHSIISVSIIYGVGMKYSRYPSVCLWGLGGVMWSPVHHKDTTMVLMGCTEVRRDLSCGGPKGKKNTVNKFENLYQMIFFSYKSSQFAERCSLPALSGHRQAAGGRAEEHQGGGEPLRGLHRLAQLHPHQLLHLNRWLWASGPRRHGEQDEKTGGIYLFIFICFLSASHGSNFTITFKPRFVRKAFAHVCCAAVTA